MPYSTTDDTAQHSGDPFHSEWERLRSSELQQLDSICDRFEESIRSNQATRIEDYIQTVSIDRQRLLACELIEIETCILQSLGLLPSLESYLNRFPQWASEIERIVNISQDTEVRKSMETQSIGGYQPQTKDTGVTGSRETESSPPANLVGTTLGAYEIRDEIGRGGMGIVYRALDLRLNREIAIKVLSPNACQHRNSRERFVREARAAGVIKHPNVVTIHSVDEIDGIPLIVMELVDGENLEQVLKHEHDLTAYEIARIGSEIAQGLGAAHRRGLIHRDIKPANILLDRNDAATTGRHILRSGRVKLTDFGLARAAADEHLTHPEVMAGTPQYMSPEQVNGEEVDHRSDLFSLGCVLYKLCTGRPPFLADSIAALLRKVADKPHEPIEQLKPDLPASLCSIVDKLLHKRPEERYQSADELTRDLQRVVDSAKDVAGSTTVSSPLIKPVVSNAKPVTATQFKFPGRGFAITSLALASFALIYWAIFYLQTNDGEFRLDTESPDVAAMLGPEGGIVVENRKNQQSFTIRKGVNRLPKGNYDLVVTSPAGVSLNTPKFEMKIGDQVIATVAMTPAETDEVEATDSATTMESLAEVKESTLGLSEFEWQEPINLGTMINTRENESHPSLTGDGLRIVFLRDSELMEGSRDDRASEFKIVNTLGELLTQGGNIDSPCISTDGLNLCFASSRNGSIGRNDIWMAHRETVDSPFGDPVHIAKGVNTKFEDSTPAFSNDMNSIWYCSGQGVQDRSVEIFQSKRNGVEAPFESSDCMKELSSGAARNFFPRLAVSDRVLLFTSVSENRGQHLRMSARKDQSKPFIGSIRLPDSINRGVIGAGSMSLDGEMLVYDCNRKDGHGQFDIWMSTRVKSHHAK